MLLITLLSVVMPFTSFSQNQINTDILEGPVRSILEKYTYLSGEIRPDIEPDPARPFVQLFYNDRIMVLDDLEPNPQEDQIRIRVYGEKIKSLFPEGLSTNIDLDNLKIAKIPEDPDNRMIIEVKVRKTVTGILNGQDYHHSSRVKFFIGFDLKDGEYRNFLIHGISPVIEHDHDLILSCSYSMHRLFSRELLDDPRFEIPLTGSWSAGIHYQYLFSSSWGVRAGLDAALNRHVLLLDKFDPLGGRNPNFKDVEWAGDLYYLELPVNILYRLQPGKRLSFEAQAGISGGYLIFADIKTSAVNTHSGKRLNGVMSDPEVYSNISSFDLAVYAGLGVNIDITPRIGINLKAGYRQGLMNKSAVEETYYPYGLYQGQFNPLFSNPGTKVYSQSYLGIIGLTFRIFGDKLL